MIRKRGGLYYVYDRHGRSVGAYRRLSSAERAEDRVFTVYRPSPRVRYYDRAPRGYHYTPTGRLVKNRRRNPWAKPAED